MLHLFLMRTCHHRHLPECRWQSVASSRRHRFPLRLFARSATIALARARLLLCSGRVRARSSSRPHHPKKVVITRISQHRCTIAAAFAHRRRKLGRRTDRRSCLPQEQLIMGGDYVLDPITQQECPMQCPRQRLQSGCEGACGCATTPNARLQPVLCAGGGPFAHASVCCV
jgi:hypothetical protein